MATTDPHPPKRKWVSLVYAPAQHMRQRFQSRALQNFPPKPDSFQVATAVLEKLTRVHNWDVNKNNARVLINTLVFLLNVSI